MLPAVLRDLHVRNLAVLAEAAVGFGPGLNVLSGETGAGKSIVVDSLALLSGGRASGELIRTGAEILTVTGAFEPVGEGWRQVLRAAGLDATEGELLVRREISREGRNRVFVNDQPATVRLLAELAPFLLTLHGQREELGLAEPELQRQWLDRSGGAEAAQLLERVADAYRRYRSLAERLERVAGDERARLQRIELLRFELQEIDAAAPQLDEEVGLRQEREVLRHAGAILEALRGAHAVLSEDEGSAGERLRRAQRLLGDVAQWEPEAPAWTTLLEELEVQLQDVSLGLARRLGEIEADPARLDEVEGRLAALERLFRRFGGGTRELLELRSRLAEELEELESDAAGRERLEAEVSVTLDAYSQVASELSRARERWSEVLCRRVMEELRELALPKARLRVRLERRRRGDSPLEVEGAPVDFGPEGLDHVVFELSPNPGEDLRPLARIASGGELARVYLALQIAVRGDGEASGCTMVFDEVDVGIGGREAAAVGKKLRNLAAGGQILVVTHLPQVASLADRHFRTRKAVKAGRTFVHVEPLSRDQRVEEVARMLAGEQITELSRSHAREMIVGAEGG
jgi:DNA repair protein RecN (Recombination protein N)